MQGDDLKADTNDTNGCPNEHVSKAIKSETVLCPTVKGTTEQVARELEERESRIEEQIHRFLYSVSEKTCIKDKIFKEAIGGVKDKIEVEEKTI